MKRIAIPLILIAVLIAASALLRREAPELDRDDALAAVLPSDGIDVKMRRFANQARIDAWDRRRQVLDWSDSSIEAIDGILGDMRTAPNFASFSEKDVWAEALIAGAYIGEVCRRHHGGTWSDSIPSVPDQQWVLSLPSGQAIFPVGWSYKRLKLGAEDNVWHKYQFSVLRNTDGGLPLEVRRVKIPSSSAE